MLRSIPRPVATLLATAGIWLSVPTSDDSASAEHRERIRYQQPQDIFYNHYVGPGCSAQAGAPAKMYPSPLPVPANVGHMYHTYPPLYPHELMYHHKRAWYTYHRGAGWTRTKAYYSSRGGLLDHLSHMHRF